mgnify:CR=1 FL=1
MRLTIFVVIFLACLSVTKAHDLRYSKVQEFLKKYPILIKESDMVDIVENENFSLLPPRETQNALPDKNYGKGQTVVKGKDGKPHVVYLV